MSPTRTEASGGAAPGFLRAVFTTAHLTFADARRRRILSAALVLGAAFVLIFAVGFHFIVREVEAAANERPWERGAVLNLATLAALYASNFLVVMTSVLVAVDTLSGEIGSGAIEALCTKPVARGAIVLGKWLGCWTILVLYEIVLCGGIMLAGLLVGGHLPPNAHLGLAFILLEGTVLLTLALAGGSRLTTLANGITVFGLYGIGFIGGWMEQLGTLAGNATARYIGIAASLLVPSESLWLLASYHMQPAVVRDMGFGPFATASVPSPAMLLWAIGYIAVTLAVAVRAFHTRDL